jgi:hypothetical protein
VRFIGDRLQYEPNPLGFLEEKKAETDTLVLYTHSAVWFPTERVFQAFGFVEAPPFANWANPKDVRSLLILSGWTLVHEECKRRPMVVCFPNGWQSRPHTAEPP